VSLIVLAHSFLTMRHFWPPQFFGVGSSLPGSPSGEPAHAVGNSFTATNAPNSRLIRWIILGKYEHQSVCSAIYEVCADGDNQYVT
jgi:hypothetical protein